MEWVESANIYGLKTVRLSTLNGSTISGFNTFILVLANPIFVEKHLNGSEILGSNWLSPTDKNMVLIGSRISSKYNLTENSVILLNDRKFIIKGVFDEVKVARFLRDIDGDFFLFKVYDPLSDKIINDSFILGSIEDFSFQDIEVHKISIVLKDEYGENATSIASKLVSLGFDFWETEEESFLSVFFIRVMSNGAVLQFYPGNPVLTLFGSWQNLMVPVLITSLIVLMNSLGAVFERRSEIRTMFTLGANPLRIRLLLMIEGLIMGVIGGILGYVVGYLFARVTSLTLPPLVQENILSGSPFTIAFMISTLSSIIGCLLPSRMSIKMVVPSGVISKKVKDIVRIDGENAVLDTPMKVQREEVKAFEAFLRDLVKTFDGTIFREIGMSNFSYAYDELANSYVWSFMLKSAGGRHADFQAFITVKNDQEIIFTLKLIDINSGKICKWTPDHKNRLKIIAPILREEILKFLIFKKKILYRSP